MAARNRMPRHLVNEHGFNDGPPSLPRGRGPIPHPIEEELLMAHDEIHRLSADNHILVDENLVIRREIAAANDELHVLSRAIPTLKAEKELEARNLIQRGLKLEAELRVLEPLKAEVMQLRTEAEKLDASRQELSAKVQGLTQDLKNLQSENQQLPAFRTEIDSLRQELARARMAYEYEKKANAEQIEHKQVMEKNLVSLAREIEKLRGELDKRARGPGGYGMLKPSPSTCYSSLYGDGHGGKKGPCAASSWASNEPRGLPRR